MNNIYVQKKITEKRIFISVIIFSVFIKILFLIYNRGLIGPDASEYIEAGKIFENNPLKYLFSNSPYTLWRLPLFPFIIFLSRQLVFLYLFQLLLSYYCAFLLFKILIKLNFNYKISFCTALFSLFIPYFNIAACSPGVEFIQVLLLIYITKKLVYHQHDEFLVISLILLCFLRPESFIVVIFIIARFLYLKKFKPALISSIPLLFVLLWMTRNLLIFGSFSMINPIMSSRAMIGSIYGVIYIEEPHPFHKKYNYYEGFDYIHKKEFVKEYKAVVKEELTNYIIHDPIAYIKHRVFSILKCFSYISLHGEHMPDKEWKIYTSNDRDFVIKNNAIWSYSNLILNKDYPRLFLRLTYHFILIIGHLFGLAYIIINYKRFGILLFMFTTFSYLLIIEADMRYFIFLQLICLCISFTLLLQLIEQCLIRIKKHE